ncbi:MAG: LptA/OstA family protein, partial [Thiothrix sp.]
MSSSHLHRSLWVLAASSPTLACAAWQACPVTMPATQGLVTPRPAQLAPEAVYIEADSAAFKASGTSTMAGNVHISQGIHAMRADQASYTHPEGLVNAQGNIQFSSADLQVRAAQLRYNLLQDTGEMQAAQYALPNANGHGFSQRVVRDSTQITRLEDSSYSTCPTEKPAWSLNAASIKLDHRKAIGTAQNATLKIRGVPVLY